SQYSSMPSFDEVLASFRTPSSNAGEDVAWPEDPHPTTPNIRINDHYSPPVQPVPPQKNVTSASALDALVAATRSAPIPAVTPSTALPPTPAVTPPIAPPPTPPIVPQEKEQIVHPV